MINLAANKKLLLLSYHLISAILIMALPLLWLIAPVMGAGESDIIPADVRNIYAGDIITLDILTQAYTTEELEKIFYDFEVVEIKEKPNGYTLSLRTFEPGEYKVMLADKEIVISVGSALGDIERDDIFEGDLRTGESGQTNRLSPWRILLYSAAGIFVLSGGFVLLRAILKRKQPALSPLQLFIRRCGALSIEDENYFVDLTFYFKEYIGSLYHCVIIGKTSTEIMGELGGIHALDADAILPDIEAWLTECDRMKFTGVDVSAEKKREHCVELLKLAEKI
jgi:hypothetical protein